jgi:type VI secretion system secreted protein VgrG
MLEQVHIAFQSGAFPDDRIRLFGARGREALSGLFELELLFACEEQDLTPEDIDRLLGAPCAVALGPDPGDVVHGLLRRIQALDTAGVRTQRYVATMVPTAWLLTLARSNRIFQNLTVPAMVELILGQYGLVAGEDFEVLLAGSYLPREYVVQYEESDWDFIQRWLEAEGIYYFFDHGGEGDKLVLTDSNSFAAPIAGPSSIRYRKRNDLATGGESTVWEWTLVQQRTPARVAVFDYNYRTPLVRLLGQATIDEQRGFGSVMIYNEHFKTNEEGNDLAKTHAEGFACRRRVFSGWTDCSRFRVGHVFELADHYASANDGQYLITAIRHRVGLAFDGSGGDLGAGGDSTSVEHYKAYFEAIPIAVPFRPERVTPWPRIHGIMHGHVDEDTAGEYAQIDEYGRYKVRVPLDAGNLGGSQASRWIRMAQAYSGTNYGAHHPLHRGAEVLLAHIDGDPDRPIIMGTAPHSTTGSPVSKTNLTQSVIHTPSGLRVEFEDLQK